MKLAILSRDSTLFSCRRLRETAQARGHKVDIIDPLYCYMNINSVASAMHYHGGRLGYYDAMIPRIGSLTTLGLAVLRQFEMLGSYSLNESAAIACARNKLCSLQLLASQGISLPITGFADSPDDIGELIAMVGGAPLVVKFVESMQGIGVVLAETKQAAESVIEAFRSLKAQFLVQEFISEACGCDIRCLVVGDQVMTAIERQAKAGDFRSNLHRGGTARLVTISATEQAIAIRATAALGLNVAGVDILRSNRGPLVVEVNASPGLEGIETASGLDIATIIIAFIEGRLANMPFQ
ncbi:MAG: ribosomal protein S6 modification protein [Sodalis sp. Psp]|nr:ribosomal protein S6 modification protein [Sodalis sp. Psp]MCR3756843.1 ribosomal protein S6 modification protein [Sodalis sp. Ppy]